MSMNQGNVVDKVAARISADVTPWQAAMLTMEKSYTDAMKRMSASGSMPSGLFSTQSFDKDLALAQQYQTKIEAMQAKINATREQSDQKLRLMYNRDERAQEAHLQKMYQNEQMFNERMRQLQAQTAFQNSSFGIRGNSSELSTGRIMNALSGNKSSGFTIGRMIASMAGFEALNGVYQTIVQGMKDVESGAAGIQQVFESQIHSQSQLNDVTNQAITIAQTYGASISDVMNGLKLYGRQYKDTATALTLLNSATLLSVVDNVNLADANKALEATMNSLGLAAKTQSDAYANSMRIVDSWSKLAHEASVSATQLMQATENSAGAAHAIGMSFDQLNALATSAVRNTGMDGRNIGNMLKSLFSSIRTDKAENALKQLDISIKQVGANGQQEFRPVFDVLLELSQKLQTTNDSQQKLLTAISGGRFQWSKVASMLSDYNTIIDAYATSINSAGAATQYAQVQMNTFGRDLTRLKDTFVQMTALSDQNGLGSFLKSIIEGLTNLLVGLEELPPAVGQTIMVIGGLLLGLKSLTSVMKTLEPLSKLLITGFRKIAPAMTEAAAATDAETVAVRAQTAAFTELDVVSGGLALVIGAIATGIAIAAIHTGEATTATEQHTQALQDQIGAMQQQYNLAQQKQQFMQTAISQEQQLKKALDDHTLSASQHNKVLNDMVDLYRAVGKATGNESLQQVNASNVNNQSLSSEQQAINNLVLAKKNAYEDAVAINNQDIQNDINATNQKIADINAVIDGLKKETVAKLSEMTLGEKTSWSWQKISGFLDSIAGGTDDGTGQSVSGSTLAQRHQQNANDIRKQARDRALQQAIATYDSLKSKQAQDQYKLASNKLDLLNIDTSGVGNGSSQGVPTGGNGKGKKISGNPFANQEANDQAAIDRYKAQIDASTFAIQAYKDELSNASNELKRNIADTQAAQNYSAAYGQEVSSLTANIKNYNTENAAINGMLTKLDGEMSGLEARYKSHEITAATYSSALKSLESEYKSLTNTVKQNASAVMQDKSAMVSATESAVSEVVNLLQQGYQAEQKIQEDRLQNIYQPQLDALNAQKTAIDDQIKSLQALWNAQAQTNSITDLQNQLANVKGQLNQEIVGPDGKLTYTYDTAKAADLEKQILDAQTKQKHDAQIQQLQDQSNALQTQIKNLTDTYNTEKKQLDDYWSYRLNADTLQTEAEAAIMKEGFTKALSDAQTFAVNMGNTLQTLKMPDLLKGEDAAKRLGLTNATNAISQFVNATNKQFQQVQADFANKMGLNIAEKNVQQFVGSVNNELSKITTQPIVLNVDVSNATSALQGLANAANNAVSAINKSKHGTILNPAYIQWDAKAYDAMHKGIPMTDILKSEPKQKWLTFSTGGEVPFGAGMPGRDSVPALLTPGEYVVPQPTMEDIWANVKGNTSHTTSAPVFQFTGDINLPNVDDAQSFAQEIREFARGFANYTRGA